MNTLWRLKWMTLGRQVLAGAQLELAGTCRIDQLRWQAQEDDARDEQVGIDNDAHVLPGLAGPVSSSALAAFLAIGLHFGFDLIFGHGR